MDDPKIPDTPVSINEPPGSNVAPVPPEQPEVDPPELLSEDELMAMTRAQIDAYALEHGVDTTGAPTKADAVAQLYAEAA